MPPEAKATSGIRSQIDLDGANLDLSFVTPLDLIIFARDSLHTAALRLFNKLNSSSAPFIFPNTASWSRAELQQGLD